MSKFMGVSAQRAARLADAFHIAPIDEISATAEPDRRIWVQANQLG